MVTNIKLAFTNLPFRHNSTCVIQKWLRFKRVIMVTLALIFVEYAIGGFSIGHLFLLFAQDYLSEDFHCHTSLILLNV